MTKENEGRSSSRHFAGAFPPVSCLTTMKRWLCSLLLLLGTVGPAWPAGLIIVDEAHWRHHLPPDGIFPPPWPHPRPRPEPWPVPPPRVYSFAPLEVTRHQASVRINDQLA